MCVASAAHFLFLKEEKMDEKFYEAPKMKLIAVDNVDIILSSNEDNDQGIWDKQ